RFCGYVFSCLFSVVLHFSFGFVPLLTFSSLYHFFSYLYRHHRDLHSFPTRRSSDLYPKTAGELPLLIAVTAIAALTGTLVRSGLDRKSTRLNSSHGSISYAVFCLKKKKNLSITDITKSRPAALMAYSKGKTNARRHS